MPIKIQVLLLSLLLPAGCVMQLHERMPEPDSASAKPWQLRCEVAQSAMPTSVDKLREVKGKWLWARDGDGNPVELAGKLEDGFYVLSGFANNDAIPSTELFRQQCLTTLAEEQFSDPTTFINMRAARLSEGINLAIVIPDETTQRVVLFGDSLSDTGRLKNRLIVFPESPYWLGRFSDGPVWIDYLEAFNHVAVQNHSYGGAFTVDHRAVPGESVLDKIKEEGQLFVSGSIDLQVSDYIDFQLTSGSLKAVEGTTFVLWSGANDYISKEPISGVIDTFLNTSKGAPGYKEMVDETILALERYLKRLYVIGARRFILMDLPDLGETPVVLQNESYMKGNSEQSDQQRRAELSKRLSALSADHNLAIIEMVARIKAQFDDVAIALVETSKYIAEISVAPNGFDYGFALEKNSKPLLLEGGAKLIQSNCYSAGYLGTRKSATVCSDRQSAMFWDVVHPTTFSHCWQTYMIAKDLAKVGWYGELPPLADYKSWCKRITNDNGVANDKKWLLRGLTTQSGR
ncbi:MAG: thermolabile hemolysin [Pseudomonadales bacterium]|jgi:thermolabile hemolysin